MKASFVEGCWRWLGVPVRPDGWHNIKKHSTKRWGNLPPRFTESFVDFVYRKPREYCGRLVPEGRILVHARESANEQGGQPPGGTAEPI